MKSAVSATLRTMSNVKKLNKIMSQISVFTHVNGYFLICSLHFYMDYLPMLLAFCRLEFSDVETKQDA